MVTVMNRKDKRWILVYAIFIIIFAIRLINITNPPLDYSSWRQVDTDSIAKNFINYKFNIFFPQLNYDGPMPNYVQLELQITTFIIAILYKLFGVSPVFGRIVPITFFMGSCIFLYKLVKKRSGVNAAMMSLLFYGLLPINIVYSRNIMPESALLFFSLGALFYFMKWIDSGKLKYYILAAAFTALAVLTKVPSAIIGIPMIYLGVDKYGLKIFKNKYIYLFPVITLGIPWIYFNWLSTIAEQNFVSGIGMNLILPNFLNAIFKKETLTYLMEQFILKIFTIPGIILFSVGVVLKKNKEEYFYYAWLFGAVLHVLLIDAVIHLDYYLIIVTPIISVFMGFVAARILFNSRYQYFLYISLVILLLNDAIFLKEAYKLKLDYIRIGNYVSQNTGRDELIVICNDSPELLYTSDRKGWRLYGEKLTAENIEKLEREGADYFVPVSTDLDKNILRYLNTNHQKIEFPDGYFMYKFMHKI